MGWTGWLGHLLILEVGFWSGGDFPSLIRSDTYFSKIPVVPVTPVTKSRLRHYQSILVTTITLACSNPSFPPLLQVSSHIFSNPCLPGNTKVTTASTISPRQNTNRRRASTETYLTSPNQVTGQHPGCP